VREQLAAGTGTAGWRAEGDAAAAD
jgi:hypothetical protein